MRSSVPSAASPPARLRSRRGRRSSSRRCGAHPAATLRRDSRPHRRALRHRRRSSRRHQHRRGRDRRRRGHRGRCAEHGGPSRGGVHPWSGPRRRGNVAAHPGDGHLPGARRGRRQGQGRTRRHLRGRRRDDGRRGGDTVRRLRVEELAELVGVFESASPSSVSHTTADGPTTSTGTQATSMLPSPASMSSRPSTSRSSKSSCDARPHCAAGIVDNLLGLVHTEPMAMRRLRPG